jgi:hypothetical protein
MVSLRVQWDHGSRKKRCLDNCEKKIRKIRNQKTGSFQNYIQYFTIVKEESLKHFWARNSRYKIFGFFS